MRRGLVLVLAWMLGGVALPVAAARAATTPAARLRSLPVERPEDPPGKPATATSLVRQGTAAGVVTFGRFRHIQVNVSGSGANIVGDAANEPSIAVDPTNHDNMAIGWRQFDTVSSNFRQAGYAFSSNGGLTWTTGRIEPGVFRSDPVLGFDAAGGFFYNSLTSSSTITTQVFPSATHGATWGTSTFAFGGDKQWMTLDRTGGIGQGRMYQAWSTASNSYAPNTFDRSIDAGASFQSPSFVDTALVWGTLDVAADGTLYVVGTDGPGGSVFVARSSNARSSVTAPTFTTSTVDLHGTITTGGPNPLGLCGQLWIGVDRSGGPRNGWVYVLGSVVTPSDPLDVMFARSTDGGATWSAPVRVNDDPPASKAWQWFGTMSVAPSGRIDVVWNDSRTSGDSTRTALYYSTSSDGGVTWSANEPASAVWNGSVGYPHQQKIGDYYQMISDNAGADLAWTATFNGEEDIYYTRITAPTTAVAAGGRPPAQLDPLDPNPFTTSTALHFAVPAAGAHVRLEVFDTSGRRIVTLANGFLPGGAQTVHWDGHEANGRDAKPGLYFCRYEAGGRAQSRKVLLVH